MSSTTERQAGQALAISSICLGALVMVAALAFDAGFIMLERRDQQNAADAAAIAGARYLKTDPAKAHDEALDIAAVNGFADDVREQAVTVNHPPLTGPFAGSSQHLEVEIASTRPSIFAGILGIAGWSVAARAVATNGDNGGGTFSILALDPTECDAMLVAGSGSLVAYGNIQVNSTCSSGALRRQGGGDINVDVPGGACDVTGDIQDGGGQGDIICVKNEGAPVLPDPLAGLPPPLYPPLAAPMIRLSGSLAHPTGCPGAATPATAEAPLRCQFTSSYAGTEWRLYPGLYPGGLKFQGGTFYFEPGVYYLGGGGLDIGGTATRTLSVAPGATTGPAGGVMFYNTALTNSAAGPVSLNGASADIDLMPLDAGTRYDGLIVFQDRTININGDDVTINGSDSDMNVRGTIYVPIGDVKVNGGGGTLTLDQIITYTYVVYGAPGSQIKVLKDEDFIMLLLTAGLVE